MIGKLHTLALAATAALGLATAGQAATVTYATTVAGFQQGPAGPAANPGTVAANRSNPAAALGSETLANGFVSLGFGGSIELGFGGTIGGSAVVFETTNGTRSGYLETATVFGRTAQGALVELARITNAAASTTVNFTGRYVSLFIRDTTTNRGGLREGRDGFDVNSVHAAVVPLPAAGLLLLAGLGGLAVAARRRKA